MKRIDSELGHFYSMFTHIDSVKLNIILELTRSSGAGGEIKFEEGMATLNGNSLLSLKHIPIYSKNENMQDLKYEQERLNKEFAGLSDLYAKDPQDTETYRKLSGIGVKRSKITDIRCKWTC